VNGLSINRCAEGVEGGVGGDGISLALSPSAADKLDVSSERDDTPRSSDVFGTPRSSVGFDSPYTNEEARASSERRRVSPVQTRKHCRSVSPGSISQLSRKSRESSGRF